MCFFIENTKANYIIKSEGKEYFLQQKAFWVYGASNQVAIDQLALDV